MMKEITQESSNINHLIVAAVIRCKISFQLEVLMTGSV